MVPNNISPFPGRLYVFEGPDGVGKTTLVEKTADCLRKLDTDPLVLSFPGKRKGTLGKVVYDLHHQLQAFDVTDLNNTSLQLLHVAAHIDCIEREILPALRAGRIVLLDRYWWSTLVYGVVNGVPEKILQHMIKLESKSWQGVIPDIIFMISRSEPYRVELDSNVWTKVKKEYRHLARRESKKVQVQNLVNECSIGDITSRIVSYITNQPKQELLPYRHKEPQQGRSIHSFSVNVRWLPTKTTPVFDTYWRFAAERQAIFFRRLSSPTVELTSDDILSTYKFTNAYRASDRVSQYLIRHVIYKGSQSPEEIFFRIMLFKTFNKIETWELLKEKLGEITYRSYSFSAYDVVFSEALLRHQSIYSAAYIMPSGVGSFGQTRKHRNHLLLLERMMRDKVPLKVSNAKKMQEVFELLRSYPMIGDFLAFQYAIDLNYSELTDFSERSFVVPGPGAKDGIRKCFSETGGLSEVDLIRLMMDRQEEEFENLGLEFQKLWGRRLQLIDCQNLFCEVDKYSRIAHPEIAGISGRTRIKQKYSPKKTVIEFFYPPKWGINEDVERSLRGVAQNGE